MDKEALDKFHDAMAILRALEDKLYGLAEAFEFTGNEKVSSRLCSLAADAGHTKKLVEDGLNGALSRALTASEQATANMLLATIAVAGRAVA